MAPSYANQPFTVEEAIAAAGPPPSFEVYGYEFVWQGEPPREFFENIHWDYAHAIFSTNNGETTFRRVKEPLNVRDVEIWDAAKIQAYADELRSKFSSQCKYIRNLEGYDGLYIYWDAHDIYHRGALNLWRVIHHMVFENIHIRAELFDSTSNWIESYVEEVLADEDNRVKLREWNFETGDIMTAFQDGELEQLDGLEQFHYTVLRGILLTRYMALRRAVEAEEQHQFGKYFHAHLRSLISQARLLTRKSNKRLSARTFLGETACV
ncbi:hypothetical protein F5Y13DRAFT_165568 [Hypoxylon sp. FL1857]|nr:hypothetical protein F5Y13DRAFT_165568 [Hypoxylon sp. FL1857]